MSSGRKLENKKEKRVLLVFLLVPPSLSRFPEWSARSRICFEMNNTAGVFDQKLQFRCHSPASPWLLTTVCVSLWAAGGGGSATVGSSFAQACAVFPALCLALYFWVRLLPHFTVEETEVQRD